MMKAYGSFSEWKKDQTAKNQRLIGTLQKLIKETAPHLTTIVKWGQGCWVDGTVPKIFIHGAADHVQLGFYGGSTMKDPNGLLIGKGKYVRHVKVQTPKDIDTVAFKKLIAEAAR